MQTIEFTTVPRNGAIAIPPEHSAQWEGKPIRVILLEEESTVLLSTESKSTDSSAIAEQSQETSSLFSRLKQVKISAPSDFSENLDAYLNGEKDL